MEKRRRKEEEGKQNSGEQRRPEGSMTCRPSHVKGKSFILLTDLTEVNLGLQFFKSLLPFFF